MCQHLHITLLRRIFSFQRNLMPLKGFQRGDVNFCLQEIKKVTFTFHAINMEAWEKFIHKYLDFPSINFYYVDKNHVLFHS